MISHRPFFYLIHIMIKIGGMVMSKDVGIIGGDIRMEYLAKIFVENGWNVKLAGHENNEIYIPSAVYCTEPCDVINTTALSVLGVPSIKNGCVYAPYSERKIIIDDLVYSVNNNEKVYGCNVPNDIQQEFKRNNINYYNYSDNDYFIWKNAAVTAECCIGIIIEKTKMTLGDLSIAILGYGRISKSLSQKLLSLNCKSTVYARNEKACAEATAMGLEAIPLIELKSHANSIDLIVNTIPYKIITKEVLDRFNGEVIELASSPGGIDIELAKEKHIQIINAGGLPGKYAPITAAKILYETILNMNGVDNY